MWVCTQPLCPLQMFACHTHAYTHTCTHSQLIQCVCIHYILNTYPTYIICTHSAHTHACVHISIEHFTHAHTLHISLNMWIFTYPTHTLHIHIHVGMCMFYHCFLLSSTFLFSIWHKNTHTIHCWPVSLKCKLYESKIVACCLCSLFRVWTAPGTEEHSVWMWWTNERKRIGELLLQGTWVTWGLAKYNIQKKIFLEKETVKAKFSGLRRPWASEQNSYQFLPGLEFPAWMEEIEFLKPKALSPRRSAQGLSYLGPRLLSRHLLADNSVFPSSPRTVCQCQARQAEGLWAAQDFWEVWELSNGTL